MDQVETSPPGGSLDLVEPAGPTTPEVSVVSLHDVGGGHAPADCYGMFADRVQELLKADRQDPLFVVLMSSGASGGINNVNFREPHKAQPLHAQMRLVANEVAAEAVRVAGSIEYATQSQPSNRDLYI